MRKETRRPLIAAFSKALIALDHEFGLFKEKSRYLGSRDVVFRKVVQPDFDPLADDFLERIKRACDPLPADEAVRLVDPVVKDAVEKTAQYGFRYFAELSQHLAPADP